MRGKAENPREGHINKPSQGKSFRHSGRGLERNEQFQDTEPVLMDYMWFIRRRHEVAAEASDFINWVSTSFIY